MRTVSRVHGCVNVHLSDSWKAIDYASYGAHAWSTFGSPFGGGMELSQAHFAWTDVHLDYSPLDYH